MLTSSQSDRIAFGLFEADLASGELWRGGFRIKLQSQPFRVLTALLERPGQVVTREDLQEKVWGKGTNVDFDHSLGTAINKIREALGDSAENPRFVETLTRRGYRFIAPVTLLEPAAAVTVEAAQPPATAASISLPSEPLPETEGPWQVAEVPSLAAPPEPFPAKAAAPKVPLRFYAVAAALLLAMLGAGFLAGRRGQRMTVLPIRQLTHGEGVLPGTDTFEMFPPHVTDGFNLYVSVIRDGRVSLDRVAVATGEGQPLGLPDEVAGPAIADISHDGTRLLVRSHASNESEQPLFIVPVNGGSAQRVARVLAHDATWMPDDSAILFASGNSLFLSRMDNSAPQRYADLPSRAFWLRWSPDGKTLRFTLFDPLAHTKSIWQVKAGSRIATPLVQTTSGGHEQCCGVWTADGGSYIFQSSTGTASDLWKIDGNRPGSLERLTDGPFSYQGPAASRTGSTLYFAGVDNQSQLQVVRPGERVFHPARSFYGAARRLEASRDGRWIAWVDGESRLWRARSDGTELLQLTPKDLQVFSAHWSPDASRLAIMARGTTGAWTIQQVLADGSDLQPLAATAGNAADPSWSPDGQKIVFGRTPDLMGKDNAPRVIQTLDLQTHAVEVLPGSADLFSPRWSPDGKSIAALSLDQKRLLLYDVASRRWRVLSTRSAADPVWSPDSRSIYANAFMDANEPVYRIGVTDGHMEEIAGVANFPSGNVIDLVFCGLLPDGSVAVRAREASANLYSASPGTQTSP